MDLTKIEDTGRYYVERIHKYSNVGRIRGSHLKRLLTAGKLHPDKIRIYKLEPIELDEL